MNSLLQELGGILLETTGMFRGYVLATMYDPEQIAMIERSLATCERRFDDAIFRWRNEHRCECAENVTRTER